MEKVKSRFTSLDVRVAVRELQPSIVGAHLQNIYDINPRTFLFKFTKKDTKILLLLESGVRIHSTQFDRENPNVLPSAFAAKLRKHLRERRLTKFEQLGFDRIVHFEFGHDNRPEQTFHLFLELYSMGNVILTDYSMKVIYLLREVKTTNKDTGEQEKLLAIGMTYNMDKCQSLQSPTDDLITSVIEDFKASSVKNALKAVLPLFAPTMIDACLYKDGIDGKAKVADVVQVIPKLIDSSRQLIKTLETDEFKYKGIIQSRSKDGLTSRVDFYPMLVCNPVADVVEFDTFNDAIDEYFHQLDESRLKERKTQQENAVNKKFDAIKREQESRIALLEEGIESYLSKAQIVEANIKLVEEAILVINTGLDNDMSWVDLEALIDAERRRQRPIALIMSKLKLHSSLVELKLPHEDTQVLVDVDVTLSGHANANRYYELRKTSMDKLARTKAAFEQAMKSAEAKVRADSHKEKKREQNLIAKRKPFWFEKFNWFTSSDSYLVISGRDMHQNEYLVKRLLKTGDAYVHADLTGASSVIVKNHRKSGADQKSPTIPHRTLVEAGAFSLCFSKAWEAKIVTSAWWVYAEQVSKTAPSGEYLATGSFIIRGKKNFLPPAQLALGFGFMFTLDEGSSNRRRDMRLERERQRDALGDAADTESINDRDTKYMEQLDERIGSEDVQIISVAKELESISIQPRSKEEKIPNNVSPIKPKGKAKDQVRGKQGKQKKLKNKYKDQDDEEREMRMKLLGSKPTIEAQDQDKPASVPVVSQPKVKKPVKAQTSTTLDLNDEELPGMGELSVIDCLTGTPTSTDTITGAIAVAAPFMVMQHYTYRVKLLPGNLKRGSAAKTALSLIFSEKKSSMSQQERNTIRSIPDAELNSTMPGKVRISGSGVEMSKIKKAMKKK
jgi:predicted ribosome quality control (RQC) complex YloA/Tae2 family protein